MSAKAETIITPQENDRYPSRVFQSPSLQTRLDPVVYNNAPPAPPLTKVDVDFYRENGYLFIKSLFDLTEVESFNNELDRLRNNPELGKREEVIKEKASQEVRSIFKIHNISPLYARLAADSRLTGVAHYLLNSDVYIHQSRLNLKPGFHGKEFYWHSDFETWHVEDGMPNMRALSMSINLTENNEFNGPLMLIPGSHKTYLTCVGQTPDNHYKKSLVQQEYGVPDEASLRDLVKNGGIIAPKGPPGSVVIFDCNTMHGSNSNITPFPRSNVFFVYNSVENRLCAPFCGKHPRPEFIAAREDCTRLPIVDHHE